MPGTFTGPWGNMTGSGSSVTLTLTGTVTSLDLLLVLVCWEPLALPGTYAGALGPNHRPVVADVVREDGTDWTDAGSQRVTEVGFFELGRWAGGAGGAPRGLAGGVANVSGRPCFPSLDGAQPSGFVGQLGVYWHPDTYDTINVNFRTLVPSEAYSVPWCVVRTWKITGWGGDPVTISGTTGVSRVEPSDYFGSGIDRWIYALRQGDTYLELPPGSGTFTSDGGDTQQYGGATVVPHHLQFGMAGRWGQGAGTFTWSNWPGATLIDTIDRSQTHAAAHLEVYYRLLPGQATGVTLNAYGTFGAQTNTQDAGTLAFRGMGGMLRGASIRVVTAAAAGALWMPQIYRRR